MKIALKMLAAAALAAASTGCSSFVDINTNPNSYTTANAPAPNAILAQALSATATLYTGGSPSYNSYASWAANYWAKSNVVSGYAEERTYTYTNSYYQGLWSGTYDNLNDYNIIQKAAVGYPNHAAIARIMKAYDFLLLVDEYGDVPYTNALKGVDNLTPSYDKAADIYKDLIVQLTGAIADINTIAGYNAAQAATAVTLVVGSEDVMFAGNMTRWKQFANSLRLRILLRESQTGDATLNAYIATQMAAVQSSPEGFITTDVLVNPGYVQSNGQQNPFYNRYGVAFTGTTSATERFYQFPTADVIAKYLGNPNGTYTTTSDPRITVLYTRGTKNGASIFNGAIAGETTPPNTTGANIGSRFVLGSATVSSGILKGYAAPTALMLLSEHLFNKAEAETRGLFTGGDGAAITDYNNAILASFLYFYRMSGGTATTVGSASATTLGFTPYTTYMATSVANKNPLVSYADAAVTPGLGKQYVILYQKYLAMNSVASAEAWADFRRAAQPKIPISTQAAQLKFPKRLIYPLSEVNTNQTNIPTGVDQYTPIFWDVID